MFIEIITGFVFFCVAILFVSISIYILKDNKNLGYK